MHTVDGLHSGMLYTSCTSCGKRGTKRVKRVSLGVKGQTRYTFGTDMQAGHLHVITSIYIDFHFVITRTCTMYMHIIYTDLVWLCNSWSVLSGIEACPSDLCPAGHMTGHVTRHHRNTAARRLLIHSLRSPTFCSVSKIVIGWNYIVYIAHKTVCTYGWKGATLLNFA